MTCLSGVVDPPLEELLDAPVDVSLEGELAVVAGIVNAQQARIVELTVRALAEDDWQGAGTLSPAHWLTIQLGVEPRVAKRIVEIDNVPVGVGRSQRIVPDRLRRIVEHRDQGCRVRGCTATHVEVHHIVFWADGGAHSGAPTGHAAESPASLRSLR